MEISQNDLPVFEEEYHHQQLAKLGIEKGIQAKCILSAENFEKLHLFTGSAFFNPIVYLVIQ
jgi:hypothetical protein